MEASTALQEDVQGMEKEDGQEERKLRQLGEHGCL